MLHVVGGEASERDRERKKEQRRERSGQPRSVYRLATGSQYRSVSRPRVRILSKVLL